MTDLHITTCLKMATHDFMHGETLATLFDRLWNQGYEAKEGEERFIVSQPEPGSVLQAAMRSLLMTVGDTRLRTFASVLWAWQADNAVWITASDDISLRALDHDSCVILEAGGEFAGTIYHRNGTVIKTGDGMFRA